MNDNASPQQQQKQQPKPSGERVPIRIEKLLFTSPNPHGVCLPDGVEGQSQTIRPHITAGEHGGVKIDIEHRPWMRVFRVAKSRKVTRTVNGKEVEEWEPMGKPYHVPESWCVSVPVEE